ncbi:hypothetical protein [Cellulophaga fucicola]|uniref:TonB protein C-terminal n=1 Tax=Cellulophaga fucicola TaxID=76595 RepID=A0A1K1QN14_9FLAO|nr:hypothetical protein [Cellulophaga fucicola]SFW61330.1 hypothetical protein SAMN05660313_02821 [Cellulophaga fucicola]
MHLNFIKLLILTMLISTAGIAQNFNDTFTVSSYGNINKDGAILNNIVFECKVSNTYKWDNSDGAKKEDKSWKIIGSVTIDGKLNATGYAYKNKIYPYNDYSGKNPKINLPDAIDARVVFVNGFNKSGNFTRYSGVNFDGHGGEKSTPHRLQDYQISSIQITSSRNASTERTIQNFLDKMSHNQNNSNSERNNSVIKKNNNENNTNSSSRNITINSNTSTNTNSRYLENLNKQVKKSNNDFENAKKKLNTTLEEFAYYQRERSDLQEDREYQRVQEIADERKKEKSREYEQKRNEEKLLRLKKNEANSYEDDFAWKYHLIYPKGKNDILSGNRGGKAEYNVLYCQIFRNSEKTLEIEKNMYTVKKYQFDIKKSNIIKFIRPENLDGKTFISIVRFTLWNFASQGETEEISSIAVTDNIEEINTIDKKTQELSKLSNLSEININQYVENINQIEYNKMLIKYGKSLNNVIDKYDELPLFHGMQWLLKEGKYDKVKIYNDYKNRFEKNIRRKMDFDLINSNRDNEKKSIRIIIEYKISKEGVYEILSSSSENAVIDNHFSEIIKSMNNNVRTPARINGNPVDFEDKFKMTIKY